MFCRYKGEGIVNGSPQKVWECLKPEPNGLRLKWDNNVKKFELLEQVSTVGFMPAVDSLSGILVCLFRLVPLYTKLLSS